MEQKSWIRAAKIYSWLVSCPENEHIYITLTEVYIYNYSYFISEKEWGCHYLRLQESTQGLENYHIQMSRGWGKLYCI